MIGKALNILSLVGYFRRAVLGFALQLCCLRYLGFFPEELQLPERVIKYVAQQLQLIPELLVFYGKRSSTQREHQRKIQALLGYRLW